MSARAWLVFVLLCGASLPPAATVQAADGKGERFLDNALPYYEPRDRRVDVEHMDLTLKLDPPSRKVEGEVTYRVRRLAEGQVLALDGVDLDVQQAHWLGADGKPGPAVAEGERKTLRFPLPPGAGPHHLQLRWHAQPKRGLYAVQPDADEKRRPVHLWTQGETQEARHWLPSPDDPDERFTWSVTLDVPAGLVALSNGDPGAVESRGKRRRHRFDLRTAHPIYLLNVVVGPFREIVHAEKPVRVSSWALPDDVRRAEIVGAKLAAMIAFLGKITGTPYPHQRYGQVWVDEFTAGGMENVTLTTLTRRALGDADSALDWEPDGLLAHEAAHQWFGDTVTCRSWADLWLNEGFATYYQKLWTLHDLGPDRFAEEMAGARDAVMHTEAAKPRSIVQDRFTRPGELFDAHSYSRGAWVLHMLRTMLGAEAFDAGIADYLRAHRFGSVETGDLRRALERHSHRSLRGFFARWVRTPGLPQLRVRAQWRPQGGGLLTVSIKQTQKADPRRPLFRLEVPVLVAGGAAEKGTIHNVVLQGRDGTLTLPMPTPPALVMPDPEMTLLVNWKVEIDADLLLGALRPERHPDTRARAILAVRGALGRAKVQAALLDLLARDPSRHVRALAAKTLGAATRSEVRAALQRATGDAEPKVRAAAVAALGELHDEKSLALLIAATKDRSAGVVREALAALQKIDRKAARTAALQVAGRPSWRDALAGAAVERLAAIADPRDLDRVWDATRPGKSKALRATAAVALASFAGMVEAARDPIRDHLEGMLQESSLRLRSAAVSALGLLSDARSRSALHAAATREAFEHLAEQMRETAKGLGKGGALEDRVQRLESTLHELRGRLESLKEERKGRHGPGGHGGPDQRGPAGDGRDKPRSGGA